MPIISDVIDFDGVDEKIKRLKLDVVIVEILITLKFDLSISLRRHANGTRGIRKQIDAGFESQGGWTKMNSGGIDWTKSVTTGARIGVEVQVSGRSDLLAVDVIHLREKLESGEIDVGIIMVPDDHLSPYLTDRTPNKKTALRHIDDRTRKLPIRIYAFSHDSEGEPLKKHRTNLGRL
jgi:hypothetical protein